MRNDLASNLWWIERCLAEADVDHTAEQLARAEAQLEYQEPVHQPSLLLT